MRLRVLGCSGGIGVGLRTTSLLLDDHTLIDAGTGVGDLTLEEMSRIRRVFVTHSHLDHLAGLPMLLDSAFEQLEGPVSVYAQAATLKAISEHLFNWTIWPDFTQLPQQGAGVLRYVEMAPENPLEQDGYMVEMILVNHAVPGVGYRVEKGGHAFAFSGDTMENDTLWARLNAHAGLDLLIVESAFTNCNQTVALQARHYTPETLAQDLRKLKHQPDIYITHAKPGDEEQILNECRLAIPERSLRPLTHGQILQI